MARNLYGCTSADFTLTESGRVVASATATVWTARTGGTQITDLTDLDGDAITSVTSDADGGIRFYGVDGDKDAYWLDTGTGDRIAVRPVDLTGETGATPALTIGTVTTGTAADASLTGTDEDPVLNLILPAVADDDTRRTFHRDAVFISTTTWPQVAAHRLGPLVYGEETIASADRCVTAGVKVLETDFGPTSDDEFVLMHDSTIDRTTTGSGTLSALTGAQVQAYRVDLQTDEFQINSSAYADQRIPTVDELVNRYRGTAVLVMEPKTAGYATTLGPIWRKAGLLDTIIIQSSSQAECEAWKAQGFVTMLLSFTTIADLTPVTAAGIEWIAYPMTGVGTAPQLSAITAAKAAGFKVATFTHLRKVEVDAALAAGSDMPMTDSPIQGLPRTAPFRTSVSFADGTYPEGVICAATFTQSITNGLLHASTYGGGAEPAHMIGALGPITSTDFTVSATFRNVAASVTSGNDVWASVCVFGPGDHYYKRTGSVITGYQAILRYSGSLQLYGFNGTSPAQIGSTVSTGALSVATDYTLTLRITPTHVIVTRVDTAHSVNQAHATYRPAAWWPHFARKQETANTLGLKSMSVS